MSDFIVSVFIVTVGFVFIYWNSKDLSLYKIKKLRHLWLYHLLFSVVFYIYTRNNAADANGYWRIAKESSAEAFQLYLSKGPGTKFMFVLNYFPAKILDLSIFAGTLIYSIIGFIGIYFFYRIIVDLIPHNYSVKGYGLFPLLLFLPSMHFWAGGVGKDTLLFFSIGMFGFALQKVGKRIPLLVLSVALSYMVRPHILIVMLMAFGGAYLISRKLQLYKRLFFFGLLISISIIILPRVLEYVSVDDGSFSDIVSRSVTQAGHLSGQDIGSSVDISSYPFPLKVLTFLYRPLFFDIHGITSLFASFENLILLILSFKILRFKPITTFKKAPIVIKGYLLFLLLGAMILSLSLSNFGIILRMKNMFLPGFLIYIYWALSFQISHKNAEVALDTERELSEPAMVDSIE
ncbi:MAG: hypothetical protein AAFP76_14260 [Bacteroidota bacterium]